MNSLAVSNTCSKTEDGKAILEKKANCQGRNVGSIRLDISILPTFYLSAVRWIHTSIDLKDKEKWDQCLSRKQCVESGVAPSKCEDQQQPLRSECGSNEKRTEVLGSACAGKVGELHHTNFCIGSKVDRLRT